MAFVVHFSPFDGRQVSSPNPKKNPADEQAEEALLVRDDSVESDEATARPSSVSK